MITEDYVSFEIAKLLKEKGFDIYVRSYYDKNEEEFITNNALWNYNISSFHYSAPTLQMAMEWLRKVHKLEIYPFHDMLQGGAWWYRIERNTGLSPVVEKEEDDIYRTYEEACEAAIKYCLENLI